MTTASRKRESRPSAALRRVLNDLRGNVEEIAHSELQEIRRRISEYRAIDDPEVLEDVLTNTHECASLMLEMFLAGRPPGGRRLERSASMVRRRVDQKVPLDAVLRAYRIGTEVIWNAILRAARTNSALHAEILFKLSPLAIHFLDVVAQTARRSYSDELTDRQRRRDRARVELSRLVLEGRGDERSFRALGSELGLDPIGFYSAVAFEPHDGDPSSPLPSVEAAALVQKLAQELGIGHDDLVETVHRGKLIVWLPHPDAESLAKAAEATESAARAVLDSTPARFAAGRSAVLRAMGNWRTIAEQAVAALEIGRAVEPSRTVHRYADVAIYHIISRNPAVTTLLENLLDHLQNEAGLLDTAESYFAHGRHLKATTASLGIHRNTLRYRLHRIEELLRGKFDDPDWSLRLQLALRFRQMRGTAARNGKHT